MSATPSPQGARVAAPPLRVLLADRSGAARHAVAGLLRNLDGVVLAGEIGSRDQLAAALRRTRADALVIDDRLLSDGDHVLAGLGPRRPGMLVLVLGVDDDPAYAARAQRLGADAWIAKDRADEQLPALLVRP
jgi:DNA-binding NarL/FixJ family response regulator